MGLKFGSNLGVGGDGKGNGISISENGAVNLHGRSTTGSIKFRFDPTEQKLDLAISANSGGGFFRGLGWTEGKDGGIGFEIGRGLKQDIGQNRTVNANVSLKADYSVDYENDGSSTVDRSLKFGISLGVSNGDLDQVGVDAAIKIAYSTDYNANAEVTNTRITEFELVGMTPRLDKAFLSADIYNKGHAQHAGHFADTGFLPGSGAPVAIFDEDNETDGTDGQTPPPSGSNSGGDNGAPPPPLQYVMPGLGGSVAVNGTTYSITDNGTKNTATHINGNKTIAVDHGNGNGSITHFNGDGEAIGGFSSYTILVR